MTSSSSFSPFGVQRRYLLGGVLAAGFVQLTPWRWASAATSGASGFMALSAYLTERNDLPAPLGARMQAAWQELDDKFNANVDALWQWIDSNHVALAELNPRLQAEKPELAKVPAQIMQIWWQGIAGSGTQVRVVTYEHALNAEAVADRLRPPSYAYGNYGSWHQNPTTFTLKRTTIRL